MNEQKIIEFSNKKKKCGYTSQKLNIIKYIGNLITYLSSHRIIHKCVYIMYMNHRLKNYISKFE